MSNVHPIVFVLLGSSAFLVCMGILGFRPARPMPVRIREGRR